jgi:hypothetical protein
VYEEKAKHLGCSMGAIPHPFRAHNDFCFLRPCPSDMGIDFFIIENLKL